MLLLIEDNDSLAVGLSMNLRFDGFETIRARTVAEGARMLADSSPDLVLLDLLLPDGSGFDLLRTIRADGIRVPVIVLSALGEESDRVLAFRLGANDYVTKPFGVLELIERIKARLIPDALRVSDVLKSGDLRLFSSSKTVTIGDKFVPLTPKEFALLRELMLANGSVLSTKQLLRSVWRTTEDIETRTVDQHVRQLRRKLEVHGYGNRIRSSPKHGFAFLPFAPKAESTPPDR